MLAAHLFLGFHVDFQFSESLSEINPEILRIFIQKEGDYLTEVYHRKKKYLGKSIEGVTDLTQLELLEEHIYSLLKKINPHYPCREFPLYLFPITR
ncbi:MULTISPECIES: hypothetical protein [Parachlamydia]|jgi:hypothetical protein|uniref:Uncharacterized protein n=2 Tax=Parachlamydia acanthamoebae TaxID=83552 RepID=F8KXT6_PARAV|nr:hypothetical protein [Parachlamydia acanthamoebae]EFB40450.1 hypothetical protein pah_c205o104 [Parachlamydia acanthamoebae str. Hall's coccus]KIA78584.1 hypothetical protein DB43_DS00110 [Parachlamydia acanthamoebae]CCB85666.1 putative uncharacterized protein [Parachlamydia acanthamoebae UV-7]